MKPYYRSPAGDVELYVGDCLPILSRLNVTADALITDPPYCSGGDVLAFTNADPTSKYCQNDDAKGRPTFAGDNRNGRSFIKWCALWLSESWRLLRDGGYAMVFTDWRQLPNVTDTLQVGGFAWRGVIAWDKGRGARAAHKGYFRHQCEYVVWGTKGKCRKAEHAGPFDGCLRHSVRQADKHHMTGKPTPLMRQLVQIVPPGGLIVDPFAGSGTTAVAAVMEGRRCIAIEQSPDYAAIAKQRIKEALATSPR